MFLIILSWFGNVDPTDYHQSLYSILKWHTLSRNNICNIVAMLYATLGNTLFYNWGYSVSKFRYYIHSSCNVVAMSKYRVTHHLETFSYVLPVKEWPNICDTIIDAVYAVLKFAVSTFKESLCVTLREKILPVLLILSALGVTVVYNAL